MSDVEKPWILLMLAGPLAAAGMAATVYGRLGLYRDGDRYRGSAGSWTACLAGPLLVLAAVAVLIVSVIGVVRA